MSVSGIAAYQNALQEFQKAQGNFSKTRSSLSLEDNSLSGGSFGDALASSLNEVNDMQSQKNQMITDFASGKNQNVHELMITMQQASLAVNMTSAVRNKVLEAYKELMRIQF